MNNNNDNNNGDTIEHYNREISEQCFLDIDHQLKYVWDIHNNKFVSCFSLNENSVEVNAQTNSSDEAFKIRRQQLRIKPQQEDAERQRIRYSRLTEEMRNKKRAEQQRRRRARFTEEQRKRYLAVEAQRQRTRRALFTEEKLKTQRAIEAERKRRHRALLTEEQLKQSLSYARMKRQRIINDGLLSEYNRAKRERYRERYVGTNDQQLLDLKLGKTRAKQLNDHIFNAVKRRVNSDCLSDVCAETGTVSEGKHSVDNDIDFESIISNVISSIQSNSELNEIIGLDLKQENIVNNSVIFKANGEHIQQILPLIGQKQINSDECEGNSCDKNITNSKQNSKTDLKDLLNRIIRRKLLIERNVKFLISMCDRMGIKEIESLNTRQKLLCDCIYVCFWPQCNANFISNVSLLDHLKLSHHKENEVNTNFNNSDDVFSLCRKCGQKFKNMDNLYDHVVMHIDKPFMCDFCENRFDAINELLFHRDYVHFKRKFKCDECDYRVKTLVTLQNHKTSVHKNQRFICNELECKGKSFTSKQGLNNHKISVHSDKRYECFWPECVASFKYAGSLRTHLKNHNGIKYLCEFPECAGKTFTLSQSLDIHLRCVHSKERPFACDWPDCGARFKIKNFLKIHIKGVHEKQAIVKPNDKVIKCLHCDCETISKQSAYIHKKRVHEKVKKFICDVLECYGKSFCTKRELNDHKNSVHSDKRPFICDWPQCNSAFKLKNNLKIHLKKVHTPVNNKK